MSKAIEVITSVSVGGSRRPTAWLGMLDSNRRIRGPAIRLKFRGNFA